VGQVDDATPISIMRRPTGGDLQQSRDRIVASLREGMAAEYPQHPHPGPAGPPIPLDRLVSVLGAGRVVAAGAGEGMRERVLVETDRAEHEALHPTPPISARLGEPRPELAQLALQAREGDGQSGRAGDQHDVEAYSRLFEDRTISQERLPGRLPESPLGAVPSHRAANLPAGADSHAAGCGPAGRGEPDQARARVQAPSGQQPLKIPPPGEPGALLQYRGAKPGRPARGSLRRWRGGRGPCDAGSGSRGRRRRCSCGGEIRALGADNASWVDTSF
jgi:hypothetical protein